MIRDEVTEEQKDKIKNILHQEQNLKEVKKFRESLAKETGMNETSFGVEIDKICARNHIFSLDQQQFARRYARKFDIDAVISDRSIKMRNTTKSSKQPLVAMPEIAVPAFKEYHPPAKGKILYRWVTNAEAKRATKEGIKKEGGPEDGIPSSLVGDQGVAISSGAVSIESMLSIDTTKIPNGVYRMVSTRTGLAEIKIMVDIPSEAISSTSGRNV